MGKEGQRGAKKGGKQNVAKRTPTSNDAACSVSDAPPQASSSLHPQLPKEELADAHFPSLSTPDVALPDMETLEGAVEAVKATIPVSVSREELRKDPIYRIMHALPRSDVLEVVRSRFAAPHCARAAAYFDLSYRKNPLRRLRLQIGCDGPTGLHLFFPRIAAHRHTLRVLDLSRNRLSAEDVVLLCNLLGFGSAGDVAASLVPDTAGRNAENADTRVQNTTVVDLALPPALSSSCSSSSRTTTGSCLELLDLSYNTKIGNSGAVHVLRALRRCPSIRAVILKSVGVDDAGALAASDIVRRWPAPLTDLSEPLSSSVLRPSTASAMKFFVNLNENYIGARGTYILGKGLPNHVSLTLSKQRPPITRERKRTREDVQYNE